MVEEEEEEEEESLSIYLNLIAGDLANLAEGWSRFAKLKLSLIDQANDEMTIVEGFMLLSLLFPPLIFNLASSIFFSLHIVALPLFYIPKFPLQYELCVPYVWEKPMAPFSCLRIL